MHINQNQNLLHRPYRWLVVVEEELKPEISVQDAEVALLQYCSLTWLLFPKKWVGKLGSLPSSIFTEASWVMIPEVETFGLMYPLTSALPSKGYKLEGGDEASKEARRGNCCGILHCSKPGADKIEVAPPKALAPIW